MMAQSMPRRSLAISGLALTLILLLSGCMSVERQFRLNGDGSGSYILTLGFREPTSGDPASVSGRVVTPLNAFAGHFKKTRATERQVTEVLASARQAAATPPERFEVDRQSARVGGSRRR